MGLADWLDVLKAWGPWGLLFAIIVGGLLRWGLAQNSERIKLGETLVIKQVEAARDMADATGAMARVADERNRVQKEMTDAISDNTEAIKALTIVQQGQHQLNITTLQDAKAEVRRLADAVSALATAMAHRGRAA